MRRAYGVLVMALAVAGCAKPATLSVENAWVRTNAVPGRPAATYFTIRGGGSAERLVRVSTPAAVRAELHEGMAGGMRPLPALMVPAGGTIVLAPGGRHIMLFELDPRLTVGATLTLRLTFADGRRLAATARLVGPANPAPY